MWAASVSPAGWYMVTRDGECGEEPVTENAGLAVRAGLVPRPPRPLSLEWVFAEMALLASALATPVTGGPVRLGEFN